MGLDLRILRPEDTDLVVTNAYHYNISIYDAVYVSLAEGLGLKMLTGDVELIKRIGNDRILPISEYEIRKV